MQYWPNQAQHYRHEVGFVANIFLFKVIRYLQNSNSDIQYISTCLFKIKFNFKVNKEMTILTDKFDGTQLKAQIPF